MNPIATMPNVGYVIFGQKTLQQAHTALDSINVRRMLLEVKRIAERAAIKIMFEQNDDVTRKRFINDVQKPLSLMQAQSGIEKFTVVMDDTNNTPEDVEAKILNGRIALVPTRTVEFVAIDFVISNSGITFK